MLWSVVLATLLAFTRGLNLPGVPIEFTHTDEVLSAISNEIAEKFADEFVDFLKTGSESTALRQLSKQLAASHTKNVFKDDISEAGAADQFFICTTCRSFVNVFSRMWRDEDGELNGENREEDTKKGMLAFCERFEIETQEVCSGLFDIYWPAIDHIMQNSLADSRTVCGMLPIDSCKVKQKEFNWKLDIAEGPVTAPKSEIPSKTANDFKVLQLTDIHYDPEYKSGSLAECDEMVCCRKTPSEGIAESKKAGYYGDYRSCDTPLRTIENAFDQIKSEHSKIDWIIHTGDIVPHNQWSTTKEGNKEIITEINTLIKEKFENIPVYPIVGNHESHPSNVFGSVDLPANLSAKWLYAHLYEEWSQWLPAETEATIVKGGYYTITPKPNFRIIALNSMDGYMYNFWLFNDGRIAIEQLQWLHDTLLAAEKAKEQVHILMHIPTGSADAWSVWSREFNRIVERFNAIISGIFTGHTHKDEMQVHYSAKKHAVAVAFNGGSLTAYQNKNPNYRLYHIAESTKQVLDHETWIFNLTEANEHGEAQAPKWFKEYQFSTAFTDNMSPAGIDDLLNKMAQDPELLKQYWTYKVTSADPHLSKSCDNKCLLKTICGLATTNYDDKERCKELQAKLQENLPETSTTPGVPTVTTTTKPEDETSTSSTSSTSPTSPTTQPPVTTQAPPGGEDGASSISAVKKTSLVGLLCLIKLLF